jgi:hypothetical protein
VSHLAVLEHCCPGHTAPSSQPQSMTSSPLQSVHQLGERHNCSSSDLYQLHLATKMEPIMGLPTTGPH